METLEQVKESRDQLRAVFPKICAALANGACCTPDVSTGFIESIPNEVACVVSHLRAEVERLRDIGCVEALMRAERAEADARRERVTWEAVAQRASDLAKSLEEAEAELKAYRDAVGAQPWASDLPIRVLLDQITSELLTTRNLLMADTEAQAELTTERARLDWLEGNAGDMHRYNSFKYIWFSHQNLRAAIDAAMKEEAK